MVESYLAHHHRCLRRVLVLLPLGKWHPADELAVRVLEHHEIPFQVCALFWVPKSSLSLQVVVTKMDLLPKQMVDLHRQHTLASLQTRIDTIPIAWPEIRVTSAKDPKTATGIAMLRRDLLDVCGISP
jgi:GTP-binding protein EngB required for normal cell division